jgi:uroporphyrinogen-III synthase
MALTLLVTRPAPQVHDWVERLRTAGLDALPLPLLAIDAVSDRRELQAAWESLPHLHLAMFVSPNAVAQFFAARPPRLAWPEPLRAAATGPGTVAALVQQGVPERLCVAPQRPPFDSSALWSCLAGEPWKGREVLIVRGDGGRDELAQHLRRAGAMLRIVQAYARRAPRWTDAERALAATAQAAPQAHLWLISSAEAVAHLTALLPGVSWAGATALATHPRIGQAARAVGFGHVIEAQPTLEGLLAAVRAHEAAS